MKVVVANETRWWESVNQDLTILNMSSAAFRGGSAIRNRASYASKQKYIVLQYHTPTLNGWIRKVTDFTFDRPTTVVYLQHGSHPYPPETPRQC